mgnify:CR=1 FL=1
MTMRYILPAVMVFALAMPAIAHATGGRDCGPHMPQQIEQSEKSAAYGVELGKQQIDQAAKAAAYGDELAKKQAEQAAKSAQYADALGKQQAEQAAKAAAYGDELGRKQAEQAQKSYEYARQLDGEQRKVLQYYASLCGEQTTKYGLDTPVPRVRDAAMEQPLKGYIAGGKSIAPPPPLPTGGLPTAPGSPVTKNNALGEPKPDLNKALNQIDNQ